MNFLTDVASFTGKELSERLVTLRAYLNEPQWVPGAAETFESRYELFQLNRLHAALEFKYPMSWPRKIIIADDDIYEEIRNNIIECNWLAPECIINNATLSEYIDWDRLVADLHNLYYEPITLTDEPKLATFGDLTFWIDERI